MTSGPAPQGAAAFDGVAGHYDARFTDQPIARHLRAKVWQRLNQVLTPEARVLEIGCGTGEDACWLSDQGCHVLATDAASAMLAQTQAKATARGAQIQTALWNARDAPPADVTAAGPYDLIFSNFGAVNCLSDLRPLADALPSLLAPGGHLCLVAINRWCLMEPLLNLRRPRMALRRIRAAKTATLEDGSALEFRFHPPRAQRQAFAGVAELTEITAIGTFLPPSEYYMSLQARPRIRAGLTWLDARLSPVWPFSRLADHTLTMFRST